MEQNELQIVTLLRNGVTDGTGNFSFFQAGNLTSMANLT
jgi:hypothetical protein